MSKAKYNIIKDVKDRIQRYTVFYENFFFNKWMGSREVEGVEREEAHFIMKKFWSEGTIATWNIKVLDKLGFAPYAPCLFNMYDFPIECNLINVRGVSNKLIPQTIQKVDKDVVLGWCTKAHKPIRFFMSKYIDRLVQIEILMDNNLGLQNIPFLLAGNGHNEDKITTIVNDILNGKIVINVDGKVMDDINLLQTQVELHAQEFNDFKRDTLSEALTFLGINNNPDMKRERQIVDEVNSNNQEIEQADSDINDELDLFSDKVNKILGKTITFVSKCAKMKEKEGVEDVSKEVHD